jgi:hypothetical protein
MYASSAMFSSMYATRAIFSSMNITMGKSLPSLLYHILFSAYILFKSSKAKQLAKSKHNAEIANQMLISYISPITIILPNIKLL